MNAHAAEPIKALMQTALSAVLQEPHRRSEILGQTAIHFAGLAKERKHAQSARILSALAQQFAEAAMAPATTDDFHEMLVERATAYEQGLEQDLDIQARSRALHDYSQAGSGHRISIAPLSWGKDATLGRSGTFQYNPSAEQIAGGTGQSGTLAFWQGQPHEAQALTVDVALVAAPLVPIVPPVHIGAGNTSSRPYGLVTYGSDGAQTSVKFDAGFGTRFTVVGSYLSVVVGMDKPMAGTFPAELSFAASIGTFASPSQAPVFLTEYVDLLPAGSMSPYIQRPQHATQLLPILSNAQSGNVLLAFYAQGQANNAPSLLFTYPIGSLLPPIPLPSEVQYVTLTNNTGIEANFRLPFQLSV